MKIKSLGLKVSLIVALMIAIIICVIVYIVSVQSDALVGNLTAKEAKTANASFAAEIKSLQEEAYLHAEIIAHLADVIDSILDGDDAKLKEALLEYATGVDTVMVTDAKGNVLMRTHSDQRGDSVMGQQIVSTTLGTGTGMATIAKGSTVGISTRGSYAIRDYNRNVIGAVVCGHDLSNPLYVDTIKANALCEATLLTATRA